MNTDHFKYFVFYTWAYGMTPKRASFDDSAALLDFIKKAKEPESGYAGISVIWGEELDFEPATFVESYRIKTKAVADATEARSP